ncbi:MAG: carboxypeptidase-like regulatory domain-containing protein, partial [Terriglobia bacterium]
MTSRSRNMVGFAKHGRGWPGKFGGTWHFLSATLVGLWIMVCAGLLCAQSDAAGALGGTISSVNQPVPGASVVLTNNATNQTLTMVSGENGSYRFSLLVPGTYRVSFSAPGFKTSEVPSMIVSVSEAPTLDANLEPGDPRERVECNCRLSMSASSTGTLVDHKTITGVPLTTRNFAQVLSMSSGTVADVNNAGTLGRGTQTVNVNGSTTAGSYAIEGAYPPSTVPNPDTIAEFKIQTSQYDAGYGAMVPSTNVMTRGGERQYHGTAWEFVRNDIFNSNAF